MLFKLCDINNKFIEYKSFCLPIDQLSNAAEFVVQQLYKKIGQKVPCYSYNLLSYNLEPIKIVCRQSYNHNNDYFTLTEIPSFIRQKQFDEASAQHNSWGSYFVGSTNVVNSSGSIRYVTSSTTASSYTYTASAPNFTYTIYDGYLR